MIDQCQFCVWGPEKDDKCEYYHLPESMRGECCQYWDLFRRKGEGAFDERRNTNLASMDRKQFIETVMMVLGISKNFANAYADEFEEHKIPYEKGYESMKAFVSPQMRGVMICAEKTLLYGHGDPNKIPNGILSVLKNEGYKEGGK